MTVANASRNVTKEMHEGINGSGKTLYMVVTVCTQTGRWLHSEDFTNKAEAMHWMKWC